jgi:serine/threonine protein kinase/tetratricopeptide (TPR) repeat protein
MTPEQWRRVGELFHEALEVPPEQRVAWAERTCTTDPEVHREVLSLLDNDRAIIHGFVEKKVKSAVASFYGAAPAIEGQRVGPYKLLWELGRGGMGTVYLAERDDEEYQTKVAIKLVRPGMDTDIILHRFRRERQILAHLQHPNIARLLDGGTTEDGRPYIVMEYIEGARITEHCDAKGLSILERLTLFLDVCSAVEYAHRHFIVHRDLKPGNILVSTAGAVKLLDFGICKLLHTDALASEETAAGTLGMLTPEYASPEQVRGEPITAASDIYSLAVVLYEMLTNQRPHRIEKLTPQALERAICEQDVVRPSLAANKAVARRLEGDLDNILLRALQKDPARRYSTVENFSDDVRRHLTHQPVKARPDTIRYRTLKFARRHRGVLTAAGLISVCLIAGIVVSLREANIARANLLEARRLANVFVFDVHDAVRDLPGSTRARQLIVETGLRFLDGLAKNSSRDWELQRELATAYHRIGDVQGNVMGANLGNTQAALESYRKAITLLDSLVDHDPENRDFQLDRLAVQQRIGALYIYTQDTRNALVSFREAERAAEELLFKSPDDEQIAEQVAQTYIAAGNALRIQSAFAASAGEDSKAAALLSKFSAKHPENRKLRQTLAAAYSSVGMDQTRLGSLQQALEQYKRALALLEQLTREDPANVECQRILLSTYSHLGDVFGNPKWRSLGDAAGALQAYQQMLAVARRLYEADPANQQAVSDYANALSRVAGTLPGRKPAERLAMLRESLKLFQQIQQVNPQNVMNRWDLGHGYGLVGDALIESHDTAGAIRAYQESISLHEALVTAGVTAPAPDLVGTHEKLALEAAKQGDRESALLHARRALEISDPVGLLAKGRSENEQRFLTPRGTAAMGLTYALLASAKHVKPADAEQHRRQAADWLQKSLVSWRQLQADPAFAPPHRQEMEQVETVLKALSKP